MFQTSIRGTIHTTLDALSQRWGGSKGDVIKSLSHIGATTGVDVLIRVESQHIVLEQVDLIDGAGAADPEVQHLDVRTPSSQLCLDLGRESVFVSYADTKGERIT